MQGRWAKTRIGEGEGLVVGFERADTGELIGDLTLMLVSAEHRGGEIGWLLHPDDGGRASRRRRRGRGWG